MGNSCSSNYSRLRNSYNGALIREVNSQSYNDDTFNASYKGKNRRMKLRKMNDVDYKMIETLKANLTPVDYLSILESIFKSIIKESPHSIDLIYTNRKSLHKLNGSIFPKFWVEKLEATDGADKNGDIDLIEFSEEEIQTKAKETNINSNTEVPSYQENTETSEQTGTYSKPTQNVEKIKQSTKSSAKISGEKRKKKIKNMTKVSLKSLENFPDLNQQNNNAQSVLKSIYNAQNTKINERLNLLTFKKVNIKADGNCFFRAVSWNLYGSESLHRDIRALIVSYISQNQIEFNKFFKPNSDDTKNYIRQLSLCGNWADEICVQATANYFNCVIHILTAAEEEWYLRCSPKTSIGRASAEPAMHLFMLYLAPSHYGVFYQNFKDN